MDLQPKQSQSVRQIQRLIMSPQMQQAIHLLQMPVQELSTVIDIELQQNPVLESDPDDDPELDSLKSDTEEEPENEEMQLDRELNFDDNNFEIIKRLDDEFRDYISEGSGNMRPQTQEEEKRQSFLENSIQATKSLFDHLMQQARETFDTPEKQAMAEAIIGNFDHSGFLLTPLSEISNLYNFPISALQEVLMKIQGFDPVGVGATSLQESLLIQLVRQGKRKSLAYKILSHHYDNLIHNHIPAIKKALKTSAEEINESIEKDISKLDLHPGSSYSRQPAAPIIPDATLLLEDDNLIVVVSNENLPPLRINHRYMQMLYDKNLTNETKEFIKNKILSAKWLLHNIFQRNETIERITHSLAKHQKAFFLDPNGLLEPLTMKTLAEELSLHESTIARAVANKYLNSPRGIFPFRFFFSNAYTNEKGLDISSKTVRGVLKEIIDNENKSKPLSDEALSTALRERGISCARRTVAKYRDQLNIGTAQQRRKFH